MMVFFRIHIILFLAVSIASAKDFVVTNSSFKDMYNNYRRSSPEIIPWPGSYWPFGENGIADTKYKVTHRYDQKYETKATEWESVVHSCTPLAAEKENYESCKAWWGHCNAWSAAALKFPEPKDSNPADVALKKGLMTELWMDSQALFIGSSEKSKPTGKWICEQSDFGAFSFWDPNPKDVFLTFTNYMGILKMGLVIDRFTGDQVWNQPIAGYVILPITSADVGEPTAYDLKMNPGLNIKKTVSLKMKLTWAEDGVPPDYVSQTQFNLNMISDSLKEESIESKDYAEYSTRVLRFKLYFDGDVKIENGQVTEAGNIIGGMWEHLEAYCTKFITQYSDGTFFNLNQTHPDFIWAPTDLDKEASGSRNVYISEKRVFSNEPGKAGAGELFEFRVPFYSQKSAFDFNSGPGFSSMSKEAKVRDNIFFVFDREGILTVVDKITWIDEKEFRFSVRVVSGQSLSDLVAALESSGITIVESKKL